MTATDSESSASWNTPLGQITVVAGAAGLISLTFDTCIPAEHTSTTTPIHGLPESRNIIEDARQQLTEYFAGTRTEFSLTLTPKGTEFQRNVWRHLESIPFGETRTYFEQSKKMGNPRAIRAVAAANGQNPIPIIIPCHRVIGSDGKLTGYAGGLDRKKWLLDHEGRLHPTGQISLF